MPRHIRSLSKSKIYHVMVRGNERKNIFQDKDDKRRYIEILAKVAGYTLCEIKSTQVQCPVSNVKREKRIYIYAYCIMDNHAHLLVNEGEDDISRIMKRIGTNYAYYFNKKHSRVGHLFQDRFKSETIEDEGYLLAAARYIHNNPVKAGIAEKASSYSWSSYNGYIDEGNPRNFITRDMILGILSEDRKKALELFIEYTEQKNADEFLDHVEINEGKTIKGYRDARAYVQNFLGNRGISISM